jgi:hypothetical protein
MKRFMVNFRTLNPHHLGQSAVLQSLQGIVHVNALTQASAQMVAETLIPEFLSLRKWGISVEVTSVAESNNTDGLPLNP